MSKCAASRHSQSRAPWNVTPDNSTARFGPKYAEWDRQIIEAKYHEHYYKLITGNNVFYEIPKIASILEALFYVTKMLKLKALNRIIVNLTDSVSPAKLKRYDGHKLAEQRLRIADHHSDVAQLTAPESDHSLLVLIVLANYLAIVDELAKPPDPAESPPPNLAAVRTVARPRTGHVVT